MRERYGCIWKIACKWVTYIMHKIYISSKLIFFIQFLFCTKKTIHLWSVRQRNTEHIHMPVYVFSNLFFYRSLFRICTVLILNIFFFGCFILIFLMLIAPCCSLTSFTFIENSFVVTSPDDVFKQKYIYVNIINMCKRILRDFEINIYI